MFVPHDVVVAACEALKCGQPVLAVGPWGTGKTTLLASIAAVIDTTQITIADDVDRTTSDHQAALGALRSGRGLLMTASEVIGLPAELYRMALDQHVHLIDIAPLDPDAMAELLFAHRVPETETARLAEQSGGIGRVAAALVADENQNCVNEREPSTTNVQLISEALRADLSPSSRFMLDLLCVTGGVPQATAQRIGLDEVEQLLRSRVAMIDGDADDSMVTVRAPAIEGTIRASMSTSRQHEILRRVIDASVHADPPRPPLQQRIRRGRWAKRSGSDEHGYARDAMHAAMVAGDFETIIELGRWLLTLDRSNTDAAHCLSIGYEALGRHCDAVAVNDLLADNVDMSWRMRRDTNRYFANRLREAFEEPYSFDDDPLSEALAHRTWLHLFAGDVLRADDDATRVIERSASSAQAVVWSSMVLPIARITLGEGASAEQLAADAAHLVNRDGVNPFGTLQLALARAMAQIRCGDAADAYEFSLTQATAEPIPMLAAAWHGLAGLAAREAGRFDEAVNHLQRCVDGVPGDVYGAITFARSELRVCQAMIGLENAESGNEEPVGLLLPLHRRNQAWVAATRGQIATAQDFARDAIDLAGAQSQLLHEVLSAVDLARFGSVSEALELLRHVTRFDNALVRAGLHVISALSTRRTDHLAAARREAITVGWRVVADELAQTLILQARTDRNPTLAARREVAFHPRQWPTPLCAKVPEPFLTARERDVAVRAAFGSASADIGADLGISTRTVDNLLGRVYPKCGVEGRRGLSQAVQDAS